MMKFTGSPSSPSPSGATSCNRSSRTTRRGRDLDRLTLRPWDRRILLVDADAFYVAVARLVDPDGAGKAPLLIDRKSTRLNSSHLVISYAVFCLKKKKTNNTVPYSTASRCCDATYG